MHYPWWYIPGLTAPMLIAIVAVVHVVVSHYAVGGGILLALENRYALRSEDGFYRDYWHSHAKFFILLTVVFGAITGVGIWWTIGLASPTATEMLIRTFVFGWAIEWCFFVMEIVAAFAFYYYWDKLPARTHSAIGFVYAFAAWISLVLITGITSFMLNSQTLLGSVTAGEGSGWPGTFWQAFLNVQFIPQTILRTGGALILATFYVYLHAAITEKNEEVRETIARRMRIPSFVGVVFLAVGVVGWLWFLTPSARMMLEKAAAMNIFMGLFAAAVVAMLLLLAVGPLRSPGKVSTGLALALFMFGVVGVGTGEFIREAVRKPFIVDQFVYGHQIYAAEVEPIREQGLLESGIWTRMYLDRLQAKYPNLKIVSETPVIRGAEPTGSVALQPLSRSNSFKPTSGDKTLAGAGSVAPTGNAGPSGPIQTPPPQAVTTVAQTGAANQTGAADNSGATAEPKPEPKAPAVKFYPAARPSVSGSRAKGNPEWLQISQEDRIGLGRVVFMYHCNDCHADRHGYSAAGPMMTGKTRDEIVRFVENLNRPGFYMPPWTGNAVEAELLADYLVTIRPDMPENITLKQEVQP